MASLLFDESLTFEQKKNSYTAKIINSKRRFNDIRNEQEFILQRDATFRRPIHQNKLLPGAITAFNTDYSFYFNGTGTVRNFVLKYLDFRFELPGAIFGGGGPDLLGPFSACPIESIELLYSSDSITTIQKIEDAYFMTSQSDGVSRVIDTFWTSGDDVSVNPSIVHILVPIPLCEGLDVAHIQENQFQCKIHTCSQTNYGTSGLGVVRLDNGAGVTLLSACYFLGIYTEDPAPVMANQMVPFSYMTPTYKFFNTFTTAVGQTTYDFEYQNTQSYTVSGATLFITDQNPTGFNWLTTLQNKVQNVQIETVAGNAMYAVVGSNDLQEEYEFYDQLTEAKVHTRMLGGLNLDFSDLSPAQYEQDNIVPQNLVNLYDRKFKVKFVNLTAATTYYVYCIMFQVAKLILHYQDNRIQKIEVVKVSVGNKRD